MTTEDKNKYFEAPQETIANAQQEKDFALKRQAAATGIAGRHGGGSQSFEKPKKGKETFKRLLGYIKPFKWKFIFVMIMGAIGAILSALGPYLSGLAINLIQDSIVARGGIFVVDIQMEFFIRLIIYTSIVYTTSAVCSFLSSFLIAGVSQKMMFGLRNQLKEKLDRLPLKYFDERQYGEILSRMTNDIDTIQSTLQQNMVQMINSVFTLISVTVMMVITNWIVMLVCIATLPLAFLATILIAKRSQKYFKAQSKSLGILNGHVEEMYSGYKIVKSYNLEESSLAKFNETNNDLYSSATKSQFLSGLAQPVLHFVSYINYAAVLVIGALSGLQIGSITTLLQYSNRFAQPIQTIAQFVNVIQNALAAAERVFDVLDAKEEDCEALQEIDPSNVTGKVVFKNVDFSYVKGTELIKDMNLKIGPGDSVAIVGPTGAGKTTLVNLLMKFYDTDAGDILIDNISSAKSDRHSVRRLFGMVLQDTWLFKGSIKDNIRFGRPDATNEEIVEAAKKARAHDFIIKLPDCYETMLNEDATNISSGQRQLLTIARALISNPKILILDEATSSVDTRTEQLIQVALSQMMKERTSFIIAHRLSTIKKSKTILVMNKGRVIEQGNHEELLAEKGFYYNLYNSQFNQPMFVDEN